MFAPYRYCIAAISNAPRFIKNPSDELVVAVKLFPERMSLYVITVQGPAFNPLSPVSEELVTPGKGLYGLSVP